jgi:hypothetical protein
MAEVVTECEGLGEIFVEAERPSCRPRDLGHLNRMSETVAKVVRERGSEDLRFLLQPSERSGMDDAISVALKRITVGVCGFNATTASTLRRIEAEPVEHCEANA